MKTFILLALVSVLLAACAPNQLPTQPAILATTTPSPLVFVLTAAASHTPSPIPLPTTTYTVSPEPDVAPNCEISNEGGQLYLLSDREFRDFGTTPGELDHVLMVHYPEWANYTQMFPLSTQPVTLGEIVQWASLDEEANLQINPAVSLVTLGDTLDWQLPSNTDLYLTSQEISTELNRLSLDWDTPQNENLRSQYPEVANSGTYAFYMFFNRNLDSLQRWCNTYQQLFGTLQ